MHEGFRKASNGYNELRKKISEESADMAKTRLRDDMLRRCQTIFIGNLDSIEKHLGKLWGHGIKAEDLTKEEMKFREIWLQLREEILDKSNYQTKNLLSSLKKYEIKDKNYHYGDQK